MKQCKVCKQTKDLEQFHKDSRFKSGYSNTCETCWADNKRKKKKFYKSRAEIYNENRRFKSQTDPKYNQRRNKQRRDWRNKKENYIKDWFNRIKCRAKRLELDFNLTLEDFEIPTFCPYLNIELTWGKNMNNSVSLDRINPDLGYVKGNVMVISQKANRIKNNATKKELLTFFENYKKLMT